MPPAHRRSRTRPHLLRCALASLAVTIPVVSVGAAVTGPPGHPARLTAAEPRPVTAATSIEARSEAVSRSANRLRAAERLARAREVTGAKRDLLSLDPGPAVVRHVEKAPPPETEPRAARNTSDDDEVAVDFPVSGNRALGLRLMLDFGFGRDQWPALEALWTRESGWNHLAENASSGAYGIPQSLPGSKMAAAGGDWRTNPATQIRWGLGYIKDRYGSPAAALAHSDAVGWY